MFSEKDYLKLTMSADISNRVIVGGYEKTGNLRRASVLEKMLAAFLALVLGAAFYIHLDVKPFLPIEIAPEQTSRWILISFVVMLFGFSVLMMFILPFLYDFVTLYFRRLVSGPACVVCASCGACTSSARYFKAGETASQIRGCKKCGSTRVYCEKCGKPALVQDFMLANGCPHCGHPYILVQER